MKTKYHPKFKTVRDRRGEPVKVRVSMLECPHCKHRCAGCHWPFTLSTAIGSLEEAIFCSQACARTGIAFDEPPAIRKIYRYWD